MAVLKNKTQSNFTMISNIILRDQELSMKDRGVLCTLCSLPDGWKFSMAGLSAIVPDGIDSIKQAIYRLEEKGYVKRSQIRGMDGKFETEIEVFGEKQPVVDLPPRDSHYGTSATDNPSQYNTDNKKGLSKTDDISIYLSDTDGQTESDAYNEIIAENIKLPWLLDIAKRHGEKEVDMVNEIYDVICDMVRFPRPNIVIKNVSYSWEVVKSRFLKLRFEHIADILNRIVDKDLEIKNMSAYLISTLYTASLVGTIEAQAKLHDDYLRCLRGNPYNI